MIFNDTTDLTGGIQLIERLTNVGNAAISNNATWLKTTTASINDAFDRILPKLLSYTSDTIRWDDINHTTTPTKKDNIVSGTNKYTIKEDDNSLDILNFTGVRILSSATATEYIDLIPMDQSDTRVADALAPNPTVSGIPTLYLEQGNDLYLYPNPNYAATDGLQTFFEREQSYFVSTDTTKEPGIPKPFHQLPFLMAAHEWLLVNKGNNTTLITRVEARIARLERDLENLISKRNPTRMRLSASTVDTR